MIEFLKRHRVVRALLGGTAVVGAGAATGQAAIGNDSPTPPKKVPLGESTKLNVEGTPVQVPLSTELPHDVLDQPNANAAQDSPASPNSAIHNSTAVGVNTTANTPRVNTTANTANTVSAEELDHRGPGHDGGDHHGPAPTAHHDGGGHDGGGDHGGSGTSGSGSGGSGTSSSGAGSGSSGSGGRGGGGGD